MIIYELISFDCVVREEEDARRPYKSGVGLDGHAHHWPAIWLMDVY